MPWIQFPSHRFDIEELNPIPWEALDDYTSAVLSYVKAWVDGDDGFHFETSGSTGTPKRLSLQRSQIEASILQTAKALDLKEGDTVLLCLDPQYIAGRMMLYRALHLGMNIFAVPPQSNPLTQIPVTVQVSLAAMVPYQIETILSSENKNRFNQFRNLLIGGAPLSQKTREQLRHFECECYLTYGMTETISHIALQRLNGFGYSDYFQAFPDIRLTTDDRGCLVIEAPYLGVDPIITNDIVELRGASQFKWLGRIDNVINSGGVKVSPERIEVVIEHVFRNLSLARLFFVTGIPHRKLGQELMLVVEGKPLLHAEEESVLSGAQASLNKFEVPRRILYLPAFVRTPTGKINRPATVQLLPTGP